MKILLIWTDVTNFLTQNMAINTLGLTVAQVLVGFLQWGIFLRQTSIMKLQATSGQISVRAHVQYSATEINSEGSEVTIKYENYGQTPALNVRSVQTDNLIDLKMFDDSEVNKLVSKLRSLTKTKEMPVAPEATLLFSFNVDALRRRPDCCRICGIQVSYDDAFRTHHSRGHSRLWGRGLKTEESIGIYLEELCLKLSWPDEQASGPTIEILSFNSSSNSSGAAPRGNVFRRSFGNIFRKAFPS